MYKITTFAIIVNLLVLSACTSTGTGSPDGTSQRPTSIDEVTTPNVPTE